VRDEQLGIRPVWVGNSPEVAHSRTLINAGAPSRHFF
jgi:hypothetical protein